MKIGVCYSKKTLKKPFHPSALLLLGFGLVNACRLSAPFFVIFVWAGTEQEQISGDKNFTKRLYFI